ncbi:MAG TPA: response regulator [Bacteroidales bacterium]|nr:response regulator [Bacteroidales bacterium]
MKRLLTVVYSVFILIMLCNYLFYRSLYHKQLNYIFELLDRQVQIVGLEVDKTNNGFLSDLNQINFDGDLTSFFSNGENRKLAIEKMKLFFSKYQTFITAIKYYDNSRNEFTLKQDTESDNIEWLESQPYITHVQSEIFNMEKLTEENRRFNYYLPVYNKSNQTIGNLVVTIDFQKYFREIFTTFNLQDYQWQWVISDSGEIIFNNYEGEIKYTNLEKITNRLAEGSVESTVHNAIINGEREEIISSYYSTQLLQRDLGLVFSAPTAFFQKYIVRNSFFIVIGTLLLIQVIIYFFWRYLKKQESEREKLETSEKMLFRLIEEMPVGVIIYNRKRQILKANKVAAEEYSYKNEEDMEGKVFPEILHTGTEVPVSGTTLHPDQFIIVKKASGDIVLYRKGIPVIFRGEDCTMEILIDVTLLESARKQEVKASEAKSEFLSRISYEIRTPLSGVIGMTDLLSKHDLSPEAKDLVRLLRGSTEVLVGIINDILDLSKIEAGNMILDEKPFNLREEISFCTDLAKTHIPPESLRLSAIVDESVPDTVIGDPFRLRQILTNLLNNSIRNTDEGEIRLKCSVNESNEGQLKLGFELADTGKSFDKAALKRIFGDAESLESGTLTTNDELTFGTSLSRHLIQLMGGNLVTESPSGLTDGLGVKLMFTVNVYSNERVNKNIPVQKILTYDSLRALVISGIARDEESLAILHQTGMFLTVTTFLKSTVNQLKSNLNIAGDRYNLIVIFDDESINGFDVASALWHNKVAQSFIIMMISSNDKKGNYMKSVTLGIDDYLIKPVTASEIRNNLKKHFPFIGEGSAENEINAGLNGLKILVVEDNKLNLKVIGTMLENMGYHFDIAEDGYTAFLQASSKKYDLILMDLNLPEIDGFEASQKILKVDKSVKIAALTADIMPETRRKAELAGIVDFIAKPVRTEELKRLFLTHFKKK